AFHGMGQDFSCFHHFATTFEDEYTTYLFSLPFHGKSRKLHADNLIISKDLWRNFLQDFLRENQINRFSVIAFSMGGRFALATVESFADSIEQLLLLAPDGITEVPIYTLATRFGITRKLFKSPIYTLATRFGITRKLFKSVLRHNYYLHKPAELLVRVGVVHQSVWKFAKMMIDTPEKQKQLYRAWIGFHRLRFDMKNIAKLLQQHRVNVFIFTGKYDKLLQRYYFGGYTRTIG
ncbi:MAG: alpha/beta hydrolase, partial [Arcicella sp.]|nr:alpha/beta hydrolase [Arcicella sp.]